MFDLMSGASRVLPSTVQTIARDVPLWAASDKTGQQCWAGLAARRFLSFMVQRERGNGFICPCDP